MSDIDQTVRITLRLPSDLHEALTKTAEKNNRSMNGEIVALLQKGMELAPFDLVKQELAQMIAAYKVMHQEERFALADRVKKLGGAEQVAKSSSISLIHDALTLDPEMAIDTPSSIYSRIAGEFKLHNLLTEEELNTLAERVHLFRMGMRGIQPDQAIPPTTTNQKTTTKK